MSTNREAERFAHRFATEHAGLENLVDRVRDCGEDERERLIGECWGGIARLADEARDASGYTTAYEQRFYAQAIHSLRQRLEGHAPRRKFTFKNRPSKAAANRTVVDPPSPSIREVAESSTGPADFKPVSPNSPTGLSKPITPPPLPASGASSPNPPCDPASSTAPASLNISSKSEDHVIPPSSAIGLSSPVSIENIDRSVIDLSDLTRPSASLTVVNVNRSLIICGMVDSAARITNVTDSVLVVSSLQVRMHQCRDCIIYLRCGSKPLFERCTNMKLAPLPAVLEDQSSSQIAFSNQWDQPDDFTWLRPGPSPNWTILPPGDRIPDHEWQTMASRCATAAPGDGNDNKTSPLSSTGTGTDSTERILHQAGLL